MGNPALSQVKCLLVGLSEVLCPTYTEPQENFTTSFIISQRIPKYPNTIPACPSSRRRLCAMQRPLAVISSGTLALVTFQHSARRAKVVSGLAVSPWGSFKLQPMATQGCRRSAWHPAQFPLANCYSRSCSCWAVSGSWRLRGCRQNVLRDRSRCGDKAQVFCSSPASDSPKSSSESEIESLYL